MKLTEEIRKCETIERKNGKKEKRNKGRVTTEKERKN